MTPATFVMSTEEVQLEVTVATCKRLLEMAYKAYTDCARDDQRSSMSYWDGYIRGIQHVLEAHNQ